MAYRYSYSYLLLHYSVSLHYPQKQSMFIPRYYIISDRLFLLVLLASLSTGLLSKPALVDSFKATSPKVLRNPARFHCFAQANPLQSVSIMESQHPDHPFCQLPGDPSLILTTNVDLGSAKLDVMKGMLLFTLCLDVFYIVNPKSLLILVFIF
jgi:hypothetical protein